MCRYGAFDAENDEEEAPEWAMDLAQGSSGGPGKLQQPVAVPFDSFDDHSSSSSDSDDEGRTSPGSGKPLQPLVLYTRVD